MESTQQNPVKEKILDLCFAAFNEQGYKSFSLDIVTKELRISKKTIYKHFSSKEEILESGIRKSLIKLSSKVSESMKNNSSRHNILAISLIYRSFLEQFSKQLRLEIKEDLPHLEGLTDIFLKDELKKQIGKNFKDLKKKGDYSYSMTTKELSEGFFRFIRSINHFEKESFSELVKIFNYGLRTIPTKKKRKKK